MYSETVHMRTRQKTIYSEINNVIFEATIGDMCSGIMAGYHEGQCWSTWKKTCFNYLFLGPWGRVLQSTRVRIWPHSWLECTKKIFRQTPWKNIRWKIQKGFFFDNSSFSYNQVTLQKRICILGCVWVWPRSRVTWPFWEKNQNWQYWEIDTNIHKQRLQK